MITVLNRETLAVTTDLAQKDRVVRALNHAGIDYKLQVRSRDGRTPMDVARTPVLSVRAPQEYLVYVRREDLPAAQAALR